MTNNRSWRISNWGDNSNEPERIPSNKNKNPLNFRTFGEAISMSLFLRWHPDSKKSDTGLT
jgi:hypothetical protein